MMAMSAPVTRKMLNEIHLCIEYYWETRAYCRPHGYENTRGWLYARLKPEEVEPAIQYLARLGGGCDCEVYTKLRPEDLPDEP
jgi:hypothetical protein